MLHTRETQWGEGGCELTLALLQRRDANIKSCFLRYTRKCELHKMIQSRFKMTFKQFYRDVQHNTNVSGPVNLMDREHLFLFLKGEADRNLGQRINWSRMLMMNHLTYDFLFHALDLCRFVPIYQECVRAVTSIKDHLRQFGINAMERYTI